MCIVITLYILQVSQQGVPIPVIHESSISPAKATTSSSSIPVTVVAAGATASSSNSEDLLSKIQTQDLMHQVRSHHKRQLAAELCCCVAVLTVLLLCYQAEKIGLEELYEGRSKNLQEQLQQSERYVTSLRTENDEQLALIQSSRAALAELRRRYDQGLLAWNNDRQHFLDKIRKVTLLATHPPRPQPPPAGNSYNRFP